MYDNIPPKSVSTLTEKQCRMLLTRIQEVLWMEHDVVNESPIYYWNRNKRGEAADILTTIATEMIKMGLSPRSND